MQLNIVKHSTYSLYSLYSLFQTGKSRGFGFVDLKFYKDSEEALKKCSGMEIDGKKIIVEYSTSGRSPTPIPGISMDDL